jgi:hypothetical protein
MRSPRLFLLLNLLLSLAALPGCHCCGWTECYADCIDDFADHKDFDRKLDSFYCEDLDATRWCIRRRCCPAPTPMYHIGYYTIQSGISRH